MIKLVTVVFMCKRIERSIAVKATNTKMNLVIANSLKELSEETVELFISSAKESIFHEGLFCAALSQDTPRFFLELLGDEPRSSELAWDKIHLFWVDEYCRRRNSRFKYNKNDTAVDYFISKVNIPSDNVHHICSKCRSCEYAASMYEHTINSVVGRKEGGVPQFDLVILRMDVGGHIGSLFPDCLAYFDTENLVHVSYFMDNRHARITLTHPVLYAASKIAILVSGEGEMEVLRDLFSEGPSEVDYPIGAIWPILSKVTWLVNRSDTEFSTPLSLLNRRMRKNVRLLKTHKAEG